MGSEAYLHEAINWPITLNSIYKTHNNPSHKGVQITTKASNDVLHTGSSYYTVIEIIKYQQNIGENNGFPRHLKNWDKNVLIANL